MLADTATTVGSVVAALLAAALLALARWVLRVDRDGRELGERVARLEGRINGGARGRRKGHTEPPRPVA